MTSLFGRPTAAELVAAVAEFLDGEVRDATDGSVNFHARVAANALRIVERELQAATATDADPAALGFADETALAAAIRSGDLDDRDNRDVIAGLRALVRRRLAVNHPGYDH